jgi:hypothetical protein
LANQRARRDLKLGKCVLPWRTEEGVSADTVRSVSLKPVAENYQRNMRRVYTLTVFPTAIVNIVSRMSRETARVREAHREDIKSGIMTPDQLQAKVRERLEAHNAARRAAIAADDQKALDSARTEMDLAFQLLNGLLGGHLQEGAEGWLASQLTGTWTAFEALAQDLWVAALNGHPRELAGLHGIKRNAKDKHKTVTLGDLANSQV